MSFFTSAAFAAVPAGAPSVATPASGLPQMLLLGGFIVIFYWMVWRPQARRAKEQRQLLSNLAIGDEVTTNGGLAGRITRLDDALLRIKISDKVEVYVQKTAVTGLLPKGTLKFS